jgi:hypothetical protein
MLIFAGKYTKKRAFSGGKYPQIARKDENKNENRNEKNAKQKICIFACASKAR